jgi:hypothetical protein
MLDREAFESYLKRGGRSPSAVKRCVRFVEEFEQYLQERGPVPGLDRAGPEELVAFIEWVEQAPGASAKTRLWAIRYYYDFASNEEMSRLAGELRQARIERKPFALRDFRGANPEHLARLAEVGIQNAKQMLEAGPSPGDRRRLSEQTGIPLPAVLELVKLSDLARIPGIAGIRARLYHDAGLDTLDKMAHWEAGDLRQHLTAFVERTGFEGIAPLPKEVSFCIEKARRLRRVVEYGPQELETG